MKRLLPILIVLLLVFPSSLSLATSTVDNGDSFDDRSFDIKIRFLMRLNYLPSLIICIVKNNSIVYLKPYGFSNLYLRKKASEDTVYISGSISKVITATALMQLYEKGFFDLDDCVSKYLPFELRNPRYPGVNITFRMLLSHQASINDFGLQPISVLPIMVSSRCSSDISNLTKEMLILGGKWYSDRYWLDHPPGDVAQYSNQGFVIAGYLVEKISGKSIEEYCREHIFKPLNMMNTSFYLDKVVKRRVAKPYTCVGGVFLPLPKYDFYFIDAAGGLFTTAEDLSHFLIAHMNAGSFEEERILREETVNLMHTIQYPNSTDLVLSRFFGGDVEIHHGLGWQIINFYGVRLVGHSGGAIGYNCHMLILRDDENEKVGVILLSNGPLLLPAFLSLKYTAVGYKMLLEAILEKVNEL
ncbi:MAG TPA: class A beta-lactamase-related serine hydrolase [Thermoplasmata archaeon]|nr:class A beta-lactamase-related serine hydrolase [Thermoplasmata archaeon]